MRILGFTKHWLKLDNPEFTTFRYPRADSAKGRDWHIGETVQIVLHPRSKGREILGTAEIIKKEERNIELNAVPNLGIRAITNAEAVADGFDNAFAMYGWVEKTYGKDCKPIINKFTLRWIQKTEVSCQ